MCPQPTIASTAFLIADPARASMLMALGQCLGWSERQHRLAGPLGVQWINLLCTNGWLRRVKATRAVQVTPQGWVWLKAQLGIEGRLGELAHDA